jgi:hypothetical protein
MTRIPELLKLPARPATRMLSLWHINDVEVAANRLQLQEDDAGLTQYYRALRRLHDVLRAYAPILNGSISKKQVRALASLVRSARKSVSVSAVLSFIEELPLDTDERESAQTILQTLRAQRAEAVAKTLDIPERFEDLTGRWRKSLRSYKVRIDPDEIPTFEFFDAVALRTVGEAGRKLQKALDEIANADDDDGIAKVARSARRLLNLIEPVASTSSAFADSIRGLNQLENLLVDISSASATATIAREHELARVCELSELTRTRLFVDLQRMWLLDNNKWFFERLYKARETTSPRAAARSNYQRVPARAAGPLHAPSAV